MYYHIKLVTEVSVNKEILDTLTIHQKWILKLKENNKTKKNIYFWKIKRHYYNILYCDENRTHYNIGTPQWTELCTSSTLNKTDLNWH